MDQQCCTNMFSSSRNRFRIALDEFAHSKATFQIVHSVPRGQPRAVKTLYVLDSSFNPPSKAHALLARNAVIRDGGAGPARLLMLLATENADKKPKPANNEDRLAMMALLADELHHGESAESLSVDIGITKKPYFSDKAKSIDDSGIYGVVEQVHLIGFDTVTRIFDSKYYPEDQKLRVLGPFLTKHRLRVTYRLDDKFGTREDQDAYIATISNGSREDEGMQKAWRARIDLVDDAKDGVGISSTEARKACMEGHQDLSKYLSEDVSRYARAMDLYVEPKVDRK